MRECNKHSSDCDGFDMSSNADVDGEPCAGLLNHTCGGTCVLFATDGRQMTTSCDRTTGKTVCFARRPLRRNSLLLGANRRACAASVAAKLSRCTALYAPPHASAAGKSAEHESTEWELAPRSGGCANAPRWLEAPRGASAVHGAIILLGDSNDRNLVHELCPTACQHFVGSADTSSGLRRCACVAHGWRVEWVYFMRGMASEEGHPALAGRQPIGSSGFARLRGSLRALVANLTAGHRPGLPVLIAAQSYFWDVDLWAQGECAALEKAAHGGFAPLLPPPRDFYANWRRHVAALLMALRGVAASSANVHVLWRSVPWLPLSANAYRECIGKGERCRFQFMPNLADVLDTLAQYGKAAAEEANVSFLDVARMGARAHTPMRPLTRSGCRETHHMAPHALRGFFHSLIEIGSSCWDPTRRGWK